MASANLSGSDIGRLIVGGGLVLGESVIAYRAKKSQQDALEASQRLAQQGIALETAQKAPNQDLLRKMGEYAFGRAQVGPDEAYRDSLAMLDRTTELQMLEVDRKSKDAIETIADSVPTGGARTRLLAEVAMNTQDEKAAITAQALKDRRELETQFRANIPTQRAQLIQSGTQALASSPNINYAGYYGLTPTSAAIYAEAQDRAEALRRISSATSSAGALIAQREREEKIAAMEAEEAEKDRQAYIQMAKLLGPPSPSAVEPLYEGRGTEVENLTKKKISPFIPQPPYGVS